jgi:hypothetical protein
MAINILCPNLRCREILIAPDMLRGRRVRCYYCGTLLQVPGGSGPDGGAKKNQKAEKKAAAPAG